MTPRAGPRRLPFLNGLYVAVDAIPGAVALVDGPYCVATKAEMQHCHNLRSGLLPPFGVARVVQTGVVPGLEEVASLALDRRATVAGVFRDVCAWPETSLLLYTSFDFHVLLNFPLEEIGTEAARLSGKLAVHVPSRSLDGDWLDGYGSACEALARALPLTPGRARAGTVAIVGHLMDRTEPDQQANVSELVRLLAALGLETVSVWLSGTGVEDLKAVEQAATVISLPYARSAARILADRLGVGLVEAPLPLGLTRTAEFLEAVGEGTGRAEQASDLVLRETAGAIRDTERHVNRFLAGSRVQVFLSDPHLEAGLASLCEDVGAAFAGEASWTPPDGDGDRDRTLAFASATHATGTGDTIPFGYPNYLDHPVTPRPFLGFAGYRVLVERMTCAALQAEAAAT